jgi:hypothetical protein
VHQIAHVPHCVAAGLAVPMSLCHILNTKCTRCDRIAQLAYEAATHPMQWSPDVLEEIWTHVRRHTGMWRARMKKRLWAEVHKELREDWIRHGIIDHTGRISWGIIETYFKNYPLPYTVVTNENEFMADGPFDPGEAATVYPLEVFENIVFNYKEIRVDVDDDLRNPSTYSYSGWCV